MDRIKKKLNNAKDKTIAFVRKDPTQAATLFTAFTVGTLKIASAYNKYANSRTWRREVKRREKKLELERNSINLD